MASEMSSADAKKKRKRKISAEPWSVKCFTDNASEIRGIIRQSGGRIERATLLRELIDEALTARRLRGIGRDTTLDFVREAQQQVVAGETDEIKEMLKDLLSIVKGNGTSIDRVVGQNREIYGVIFHILRMSLGIEELAQEYLARPVLEEEGKDDRAISDIFSEAQTEGANQAHTIIEAVRSQMNQASV